MQKVNEHVDMFVDIYFYVTSYEGSLFLKKGGKSKSSLKKEGGKLDYFLFILGTTLKN